MDSTSTICCAALRCGQECFHAAALVAEHDFQVQDLFAVALKPEVAGFNHTGMHRPDRDLMNFLALDPVKIIRLAVLPPIITSADWSQPRVIFGDDPGLLEELALEIVYARENHWRRIRSVGRFSPSGSKSATSHARWGPQARTRRECHSRPPFRRTARPDRYPLPASDAPQQPRTQLPGPERRERSTSSNGLSRTQLITKIRTRQESNAAARRGNQVEE